MKRKFISVLFLALSTYTFAFERLQYSINEKWQFSQPDKAPTIISLPHTWNAADAVDDEVGYNRLKATYSKQIFVPQDYANKQIYIFFEGANQETELYVNNHFAGKHIGGYTRFCFDITPFVNYNAQNTLLVSVSNQHNENIPPLSADYTFFGGIYRDVYLIITEKTHISLTDASSGIYVSTPMVTTNEAQISIKTLLCNTFSKSNRIRIEHTIVAPDGTSRTITDRVKLDANSIDKMHTSDLKIDHPYLWSIDTPHLYQIHTKLYDQNGNNILDNSFTTFGIRWFEFSTDKGFVLNGEQVKLIGTNRHQCFSNLGNALPDEIHVRDIKLLKAMGGNFLRVSHYPQDPTIMEMCDKLGIVCSVEIPIINAITENEDFYKNCVNMAHEMILQDFNRPSVCIWAYMNEVLLRLPFKKDSSRHQLYKTHVAELATLIEKQIRTDDPYRYTMIPIHANFKEYHTADITQIPMLLGLNLYNGWYSGKFHDFDKAVDAIHKQLPQTPLFITEYGADVDYRLHSFKPVRFDYTQEYANKYHEHYITAIQERSFVVGAAIWNLNDFHSEGRGNAVPHLNCKGIVTSTRLKKDTYLQYQATLLKQPVVSISGRNWLVRGGVENENGHCVQPVKVYSNLSEIELFVNGNSIGTQKVEENRCEFEVPFTQGENVIEAVGVAAEKRICDLLKIDFLLIPNDFKNISEMNILFGSNRYFADERGHVCWIPEQDYMFGTWGYTGGTPYAKKTNHGQQPACDANILGTDNDPIYQTARIGIESFKADLPNGQYTIEFHWAELQTTNEPQISIYNLGNDAIKEDFSGRIMNVYVNNSLLFKDLNLEEQYGLQTAVIKKCLVNITDGNGLEIRFEATKGQTLLNALRIYRNY